MSSSRPVGPKPVSDDIPAVPLTIEGYNVLHQMMRVRWSAWRPLAAPDKSAIVGEAAVSRAGWNRIPVGNRRCFRCWGIRAT